MSATGNSLKSDYALAFQLLPDPIGLLAKPNNIGHVRPIFNTPVFRTYRKALALLLFPHRLCGTD